MDQMRLHADAMEQVGVQADSAEKMNAAPADGPGVRANRMTRLLLALCLSVTLFLFAPLELYMTNRQEFWFTLETLLPVFLGLCAVSVCVIYLVLACAKGRVRDLLLALLLFAALGFYVQGNFLTKGYPLITGDAVDWNSMRDLGLLSTGVWALLLAGSLALCFLKPSWLYKAARGASILILGIELITLGTVILSMPAGEQKTATVSYFSDEELYHFSPDQNIITIVIDSLEGARFEALLAEGEVDLESMFEDFTQYRNTTGVGQYTLQSLTKLLTDSLYPVDTPQRTALGDAFAQTTVYDTLQGYGYDTNVYTFTDFACKEAIGKIGNVKMLSSIPRGNILVTMTKQMYKLVLYRYMPHDLKRYFMRFGLVFVQDEAAFSDQYYLDDLASWKRLQKDGVSATHAGKLYSLYHFYGLHGPYRLTREVAYDTSYVDDEGDEVKMQQRLNEQGYAVLSMVGELLERLRQAGVYDDAAILITADHGSRTQYRYAPVLLVKLPGERHAFCSSDAPISLAEDYLPLIMDLASGTDAAERLAAIAADPGRVRTVYHWGGGEGAWLGAVGDFQKITVTGDANDPASYSTDLFGE